MKIMFLSYPDIQLLSPLKPQVAYRKEHTWFVITWSIMQCDANFIRDRLHSIKKATLYAKEFHTSKEFWHFPFNHFILLLVEKKFYSLRNAICDRTQITINYYS